MKKISRFLRKNRQAILSTLLTVIVFTVYIMSVVVRGVPHPLRIGAVFMLVLIAGIVAIALVEKKINAKKGAVRDKQLLSRTMFEAIDTMTSPVLMCRADGRIFWCNEGLRLAMPDGRKPYGRTVSDLLGTSQDNIKAAPDDDGIGVDFAGRYFIAKYTPIKFEHGGALITLTESSELKTMGDELELIHERLEDADPVVAYVFVDNLTEMVQYDSESYRPAAAKIDEILREWATEAKGVIKEFERNRYLFVFEKKYLNEYIEKKFDVLDRIRDIRVGAEQLSVTVSVGIAAVYGGFADKEKAARAALEMALGRGGDQVAVKTDETTEFYGGRTKASRRRSSVRSRVVSNELLMHISRSSNVIIMGHRYPDYDSIASCVGLARIPRCGGVDVKIVADADDANVALCRELLRGVHEFDDVFITPDEGLDLMQTDTFVIMSDVNNMSIVADTAIIGEARRYAVIDHHRKQAEFAREPVLEYIEPKASSASELVSEMLEQVLPQEMLSVGEANLLLAGIMLDTKQFTRMTGTRTYGAALYLHDIGAEPQAVQELFKTDLEEYQREAQFRSNVVIYRHSMAITILDGDGEVSDKITASKAAEGLIGVKGVKAAFAIVTLDGSMHISARSGGEINVQLILEKLKGGGHFDTAGAQIAGVNAEEAVRMLKKSIDEYLDDADDV
ncbi:MAG: DHH family phosphoesterase [Clostridia bacterium]|nr:DHH family phosphoesterase [Clostridia bacterium]